jgi:hypothetical protein
VHLDFRPPDDLSAAIVSLATRERLSLATTVKLLVEHALATRGRRRLKEVILTAPGLARSCGSRRRGGGPRCR